MHLGGAADGENPDQRPDIKVYGFTLSGLGYDAVGTLHELTYLLLLFAGQGPWQGQGVGGENGLRHFAGVGFDCCYPYSRHEFPVEAGGGFAAILQGPGQIHDDEFRQALGSRGQGRTEGNLRAGIEPLGVIERDGCPAQGAEDRLQHLQVPEITDVAQPGIMDDVFEMTGGI